MSPLGIHDYIEKNLRINPSFRAVESTQDADLKKRLKEDTRDVLALLCHDALFIDGFRISRKHRAPIITALALLSRASFKVSLKVQGRERLRRRLKMALDLLPSVQEKIDAVVDVQLAVGSMEYFILVLKPSSDELYGVLRVALTA